MSKIIAIDGPAASGKGTLARNIAKALDFAHLDTGALYRAVAYEVLQAGGNPENEGHASAAAERVAEALSSSSPDNILHNKIIREDHVGTMASQVAAIPAVRAAIKQLQQDFASTPPAPHKGAVLDGRDIGTVIAPQADVKFFITANVETRAKRRHKELQSLGKDDTYASVLADLRERDARDAGRATSPMTPADDAVPLDTSNLTPDQALAQAMDIINSKLS